MNPAWPEATCPEDNWAPALINLCGKLKENPANAKVRGSAMIRRICLGFSEQFPPVEKAVSEWTLTDMQLSAVRGLLETIQRELDWESKARQSGN